MRIVKGLGLGVVIIFIGLFAYANLREVTLTEQLPTVEMLQFQLKGISTQENAQAVKAAAEAIEGVTAVSVDQSTQVAAVMIQPTKTSADDVAEVMSLNGKIQVNQNDLSLGKACPVAGPMAWFGDFLSALNIRS